MNESAKLPRNAETELQACYVMLEEIKDETLRTVAIAIFAPTGTFVPRPIDHSVAFSRIPSGIMTEIKNRGGLVKAFQSDRQAYSKLSEAINHIHALYKAREVGSGSGFSLDEALERISSRRVFRAS